MTHIEVAERIVEQGGLAITGIIVGFFGFKK